MRLIAEHAKRRTGPGSLASAQLPAVAPVNLYWLYLLSEDVPDPTCLPPGHWWMRALTVFSLLCIAEPSRPQEKNNLCGCGRTVVPQVGHLDSWNSVSSCKEIRNSWGMEESAWYQERMAWEPRCSSSWRAALVMELGKQEHEQQQS